jgi:hypothetical protein
MSFGTHLCINTCRLKYKRPELVWPGAKPGKQLLRQGQVPPHPVDTKSVTLSLLHQHTQNLELRQEVMTS